MDHEKVNDLLVRPLSHVYLYIFVLAICETPSSVPPRVGYIHIFRDYNSCTT
jgi:hypothetical protein